MVTFSGETMASQWTVKIAESIPDEQLQVIQSGIEDVLAIVNQQFSPFLPQSEISQFNQNLNINLAIPISDEMRYVVENALKICSETKGIYDITIAPLVNLWGFGTTEVNEHPQSEQIKQALQHVNYQALTLNELGLCKQHPNIQINLCSIAKGYGVDQVAMFLEKLGFHHYLVEIGGELRLSGNNDGKTWVVGLERPQWGGGVYEQILTFKDVTMGIATSGNYRNYFKDKGKIAAHEINTKTGYSSASQILSVTVLAENCMLADGYATALFLLGNEALMFAEEHQIAALFMLSSPDNAAGYRIQISNTFSQIIHSQN